MKTFCEHQPTNYSRATFEGVEQFGAWLDTGHGKAAMKPEDMPKQGDQIVIKTKSGDLHTRIVGKKAIAYKSGRILQLIKDDGIAQKAEQKYQALEAVSTGYSVKHTKVNGLCPRCGSYCYGDCTASA